MAEVGAMDIERWLQDYDADLVNEIPPNLNEWYEVFDAEDVRHLLCVIYQSNDEVAAKDIEVMWTIDGNEYFISVALANATNIWIYRNHEASVGGTAGLAQSASVVNAARFVDKRGLEYKVEVRITSALGTNQRLTCWCVRETQEIT